VAGHWVDSYRQIGCPWRPRLFVVLVTWPDRAGLP